MLPNHDELRSELEDASKETMNRDVTGDDHADELSGNMKRDNQHDKLMHTVLEAEKQKIEQAKAVNEAANNNISSFTPELALDRFVDNYRYAKQLYGDTLIRELTGYDSRYVERNINIPEFQRELKEQIKQNVDSMRREGILTDEYTIDEEGYRYAALQLIDEELKDLEGKGILGKKESPRRDRTGDRVGHKRYDSSQPYKDIDIRKTLRTAIRRGKTDVGVEDLRSHEREAKGNIEVVYLVDTSGSMKGQKIKTAKKAGVALAYKAEQHRDKVGLVIFSSEAHRAVPVGEDLLEISKNLSKVRTGGETDIGKAVESALGLFSTQASTKHIIVLSDALQTKGKDPAEEVFPVLDKAKAQDVSFTILGISLDEKGRSFAEQLVNRTNGSMYEVENLDDVDTIIVTDYMRLRSGRS